MSQGVLGYKIYRLSFLKKGKKVKTEKNILIAFILNLAFSVFEFVGGIITGSVAIISDAVHDIGDAASIGISFFLEFPSFSSNNMDFSTGNHFVARFFLLFSGIHVK